MRACFGPDVLQENPGSTAMLVDDIELKGNAPIRRLSHRIQESLLVAMRRPSVHNGDHCQQLTRREWGNPIVLVPKKDGEIWSCVVFCYLNNISTFDSYPTSHIDDLRKGQILNHY